MVYSNGFDRAQGTTRIALAITRDRNRELLTTLFAGQDIVEITDSVPEGTDLCLVDERGLARTGQALTAWRERQYPVFTPALLLTESETDDLWARYEDGLSRQIDTIMQIPAPKMAIIARIETLLEMRDFSQRLQAEHQLTARIFETSPLAKTILDTEGNIVRASERAEELLGLTRATVSSRTYEQPEYDIFDENGDPIPSEELPFAHVVATGDPVYGYEHGIEVPGDDRMWLSVNMAPIRDETGDIEYVVATLEDITIRRSQQRELERQLDLFEKAQHIANVGAWEYDIRTDESYWTEEVGSIYGLPASVDLSPESSFRYFHPEDRPIIEDAFERAVENGDPFDLELRLVDEGGTQRWVRTHAEPQYVDGELARIRGTIQDITEQKERELELQRMSRAVDTAPIGVTLSDPTMEDNPLVYVNDGFVDLTGYSRAEATGRNCRFLQGENTDPDTVASIRRAIDAEEPVSAVVRNYRADGTEFWNNLEIAPVRNATGEVINYIGFQQDVTERVERQQQLQTLDRYLRHNLRNKMNVIQGLAELIQEEGSPPVTDYADSIHDTSSLLLDNMKKERAITKVLRHNPSLKTIAVMSVLRTTVTELRRRYPHASITLSGPDEVSARCVARIGKLFEELITNAIVHNDGETPTVDVTVEQNGDRVAVQVADDGPGIPEMEIGVLTGTEEETTVYHGQGLGLWLVYLIVRRSGGTIEFEDGDDGGSVVTVHLSTGEPA